MIKCVLINFLSCYYVDYKPKDVNDCQPEILDSCINERNDVDSIDIYPFSVSLMSSKQKVRRPSSKAVLRYHTPNFDKYPEKYAHHMLFMFLPFRSESELLADDGSYMTKLATQDAYDVISQNRGHLMRNRSHLMTLLMLLSEIFIQIGQITQTLSVNKKMMRSLSLHSLQVRMIVLSKILKHV